MSNLLGPRWAFSLVLLVASIMVWTFACGAASSRGASGPGAGSPASDNGSALRPEAPAADQGPAPQPASPSAQDSASPDATPRPVGSGVGERAPELVGITNWINSPPLTLADLRGKVVLVDVWTYTCVNCIRTFPYLREWHARYADHGLVIIGLHAPEFEFEKLARNVEQAAREHGIIWPIAQDNDFNTWRAYNNRYWPAKYLIDRHGVVRYTHFGEGAYAETEEIIRELLKEAGANLSPVDPELPSDQPLDAAYEDLRLATQGKVEITPELYAGYERNFSAVLYGIDPYVVQPEYYQHRDQVATLTPPENLAPHKIYFSGEWFVGAEMARQARETRNYENYIAVNYSAKSVNAVITSQSALPYKIRVTMDGQYLTEKNRGQDVTIGPDGESYIMVTGPRMYSIVDNPKYLERRVLELRANSSDFSLFAFTFGVYQEGP